MKKLISGVVAVGLVFLLAGKASAASCTTGLTDTTNPVCKADLMCQKGIHDATVTYVQKVGLGMNNLLYKSQKVAYVSLPKAACVGGSNNDLACTNNAGCPFTAPAVAQCIPQASKNDGSKDYLKAQQTLSASIHKKCDAAATPALAGDLGLGNIPDCTIDAGAADADQFEALATCIESSLAGDANTGNTVDSILLAIAKGTGTKGAATKPFGKAGKRTEPRVITQLQGSTLLQIGNGASTSAPTIGTGGSVTYASLAHCSNGALACIKDANCGKGATCISDCTGGSPDMCYGHGINADMNDLSMQATCSDVSGLATCLRTETKAAGNGTDTLVTINLTSGAYASTSPISTQVYLTGMGVVGCSTYHSCPICNASLLCEGDCVTPPFSTFTGTTCTKDADCSPGDICTAGAQTATMPCATDQVGQMGVFCIPALSIDLGGVPNPFLLTTTPSSLLPGAGEGGKFCGRCSVTKGTGCQVAATDCPAGESCKWNDSTDQPGFNGDTTVSRIDSNGIASQWTPVIVGVFCTGITGNSIVDGNAGLPGPVRFISQDVHGYAFSTDAAPGL